MLYKNTWISSDIENFKIPAGFLADFSLLQLIGMFVVLKLFPKYKSKIVHIDDLLEYAMLTYGPPKYPLLNRQTLSIYVSALNSHCPCDNVNVPFILVYVLFYYKYTMLDWIKFILTLSLNHFITCLKTLVKEFNHNSWNSENILSLIFSKSLGNLEHRSGQDQDNSTCTYVAHFKDL